MNTDHTKRLRVLVDGKPLPGNTPPPARHVDYWPVINLGVDCRKFVVLAPRWWGIYTHFVRPRTIPCLTAFGSDCRDCLLAERRWSGYLAVASPTAPGPHLLHLTANAVQSCPELQDETCDLRGRSLEVARQPRSRLGKMLARVGDVSPTWTGRGEVSVERTALQVLAIWGLPFTVLEGQP